MKTMKGYKVTTKTRTKLIGVACNSLAQLLIKGGEKLGIGENIVAALDDGTIVDDEDYFQALLPQTVFVLYKKDEEVVTGVDVILNILRRVNSSYLETGSKAKQLVLEKANELMSIVKKEENDEKMTIMKNTRQEDPDWFANLDTNAKTKADYMFRKSQDRIRGYFYKFQEDIRKNKLFLQDQTFREISLDCLGVLKKRLQADKYFGCYFDRRCARQQAEDVGNTEPKCKKFRFDSEKDSGNFVLTYDKTSYCDEFGNFECQGKWKLDRCEFKGDHQINPYLSREARILFSTWNLDHRIERSRSVTPTLVETISRCGKSQSVNFSYFYQLLFTKWNLKLVHVVCHEKSVHDVSCDPRLVYA